MLKATSTSDSNAGFHYILLLDPNTFENLHQVVAEAQNGNYTFQFTEIPEGDYILYAGTDLDNDFAIGDAGEAAGAYLSLDQPVLLNVTGNLSGLDFSTGFSTDLTDVQTYRKTGAQPNLQDIRILRRKGE
jgi:serine protease